MTHALRIGYLVPRFPGQTHGPIRREIEALEAMGHDIHVLSSRPPPKALMPHSWSDAAVARTTYLGSMKLPWRKRCWEIPLLSRRPFRALRDAVQFARDIPLCLPASIRLLRVARKRNLDHLHVSGGGRSALAAALARKMGGPPYSLALRMPEAACRPGYRFKWRHAAFGTVTTRNLHDRLLETVGDDLPERVILKPEGVDFGAMRRQTPYAPPERGRPVRIFSCARLSPEKGHHDLMSAIRQLLDQGVDVRLEIAGEDDNAGKGFRSKLEAHLKKLHLQDHVRLLGAMDEDAVRAKLEEAHLFALSAPGSPAGVAYMEAMAMGVPTIGTEAGAPHELIEDGRTGCLVPPRNPGAMARAIRALVQDPDALMKLSANGRARVEAHYRVEFGAMALAEEIARLKSYSPEAATG